MTVIGHHKYVLRPNLLAYQFICVSSVTEFSKEQNKRSRFTVRLHSKCIRTTAPAENYPPPPPPPPRLVLGFGLGLALKLGLGGFSSGAIVLELSL